MKPNKCTIGKKVKFYKESTKKWYKGEVSSEVSKLGFVNVLVIVEKVVKGFPTCTAKEFKVHCAELKSNSLRKMVSCEPFVGNLSQIIIEEDAKVTAVLNKVADMTTVSTSAEKEAALKRAYEIGQLRTYDGKLTADLQETVSAINLFMEKCENPYNFMGTTVNPSLEKCENPYTNIAIYSDEPEKKANIFVRFWNFICGV